MSDTIRATTIYPHRVRLEACDRYNDYSVVYDHFVTVEYGDGKWQRFDVGTNQAKAIGKYDAAVTLIFAGAAIENQMRVA